MVFSWVCMWTSLFCHYLCCCCKFKLMGNCLCFYSVDWTVAIATIVITIYVGAHNKFTVEHNQPNGVLMVIASRTHKKRTEWMDERKKEREWKRMKENRLHRLCCDGKCILSFWTNRKKPKLTDNQPTWWLLSPIFWSCLLICIFLSFFFGCERVFPILDHYMVRWANDHSHLSSVW